MLSNNTIPKVTPELSGETTPKNTSANGHKKAVGRQSRNRAPEKNKTNPRCNTHIPRRELNRILEAAFCYMPQPHEITEEAYGDETELVRHEVSSARNMLTRMGTTPEKVYEKYDSERLLKKLAQTKNKENPQKAA